ncbi:MAG TPA: GIY-YIG nuclease family protein [Alphaproteobacteria bacterium]|nr:GIY-YIG nuclease family protein [Alphaproteobacteria bacterium]
MAILSSQYHGKTLPVRAHADQPYGTLYVGITNNIARRAWEHRKGAVQGYTKKYGIKMLVWYAEFPTALEAIAFEKKLKKWKRLWKIELVKKFNPEWRDLYETLNQ